MSSESFRVSHLRDTEFVLDVLRTCAEKLDVCLQLRNLSEADSDLYENERIILDDTVEAVRNTLEAYRPTHEVLVWKTNRLKKSFSRETFKLPTCASEVQQLADTVYDATTSFHNWILLEKAALSHSELTAETDPRVATNEGSSSESGRVQLFGRNEAPVIDGCKKPTLTNAQYDVVSTLLQTGNEGLTKDELDRKSKRGDARKILKRLSKADSDWESVISFPGTTGKGYRIV